MCVCVCRGLLTRRVLWCEMPSLKRGSSQVDTRLSGFDVFCGVISVNLFYTTWCGVGDDLRG